MKMSTNVLHPTICFVDAGANDKTDINSYLVL